jgi:molybdopterin/thiamine biosynthesis adenylyltransferase/rhodanese-related sulfurtransferase
MLTSPELERYARQLALPEIGIEGQERLRKAAVLVVGAGGLGSPAALYLAAAGVGRLGLLDSDEVEVSNLHRQILHATGDIGRPKTESGAATLARLNSHVDVQILHERLNAHRARALASAYDVVVDGSDNYATRYAINDACVVARTPWVYGSVERFAGQLSVFGVADGPCYRCLYPVAPAPGSSPSCEEIGVLGAVPGVIGSMQAVEALKLLLGIGRPLAGRLLQVDFLRGDWRTIAFDRRADCPACGSTRHGTVETNAEMVPADVEPRDLVEIMRDVRSAQPDLIDVREPWEWNIARIEGARLMPMAELQIQVGALDRDRDMVIYCHHGTRSAAVVEWLRAQGFRARNLSGGIDRWSREIDQSIRRY